MSAEGFATLVNLGVGGAVVAVVVIFLKFIRERDRDWQTFFTQIRLTDQEHNKKQMSILESLVDCVKNLDGKFDRHDATELEILRDLTKQPTQRRRKEKDAPG